MKPLHPYYINKHRKNIEMVETWFYALWICIQLGVIYYCSHYTYHKIMELVNALK
jgi:hypothetical protein